MRIAAITMARNEKHLLPLWISHYGRQIGPDNLYVVDHGSDDGSTKGISARVLNLPASELDDFKRSEFISDLHASLLAFYDAVIYTDVDELLVADPERWKTLAEFIAAGHYPTLCCKGLDVRQVVGIDADLDLGMPILSQRTWVQFTPYHCKPVISSQRLRWTPGFHYADVKFLMHEDLYLFHLKKIDKSIGLLQQRSRREVSLSERHVKEGMGTHFHDDDATLIERNFSMTESAATALATDDFPFSSACRAFAQDRGRFVRSAWPMARIPARFRDTIQGR